MTKMQPEPQEHTGSYYAATVNWISDYPALQGEHQADVCVIGAGFTGVSTALHLSERGYKVRVLEANRVGWGASGRNGGELIGGFSGEWKLAKRLGSQGEALIWEMRWAGHDIIRQRVARYQIDCDLKWGYLDVAIKPRDLRAQQMEMELLAKHGYDREYRQLSAAETRELIGTDAYVGALLNMGNGHLHPLNLCLGEAKAAVDLGAVIHEQSPVVRIEQAARPRVVTRQGAVTADAVVLAGNAYHRLDRRLRHHALPVNSFVTVTEPLSNELVDEINAQDLAVCDPNFVLEYFRLTADKRLLFGSRCNYFGSDPERIKALLRRKLLRIYPQLAGVTLEYAWGGTIAVTANRVPQLGCLEPNVFYAQGYCGHGVNNTHLAGQIMAEAVAGTMERMDVFANVRPIPIPGAWSFTRPLVSLGMLYFQLRDKL